MLTKEQAQDQLASIYLRTKVARLVQKTRRRAVEYINSNLGVAHFERTARVLAREMVQRRRRLRKLYKKYIKNRQHIDARREKLRRKIEAFQRAKEARLKATRDKCTRLEKERETLERVRDAAMTKDKAGALAAAKTKKLNKLDEKLSKSRTELEEAESELGAPENGKIYELEQAIERLDMEERKLVTATEKSRAREMNAAIGEDDEEESDEEDDGEDGGDGEEGESNVEDNDSDGGEEEEDSEEEEEDAPETEVSKVSSAAPIEAPETSFFQVDMPDMKIDDYRIAAVKAVDQELEKRAIELEQDSKKQRQKVSVASVVKKPTFIMPLDVPEEELFELFQTQIRDSYVEMQCTKVSKQATKEFLQMRAVLQRWRGLGTRAVFEAWHEVARASRLDANAVKARQERKKLLEKQNRELEEQLARIEARRWVLRTDMYTDAIYYENESTGETRWDSLQYWAEEQQLKQKERQVTRNGGVPVLKLPPI
ncbi:unnamed protein product [Phytophthora fragariaefolia]|uniref:Unnamed protein product n=1 Tax=Phytophthora fragariaefolia TaxID=1490495 RepID=A0A9W6Y1F9_9STRA|nr:unnamed protein product [Phytophthora fragariaefolia]